MTHADRPCDDGKNQIERSRNQTKQKKKQTQRPDVTLTDNNIVGISLTDRNVFFFSVFVFGLTTCFGQCFKFKKKERERKKNKR